MLSVYRAMDATRRRRAGDRHDNTEQKRTYFGIIRTDGELWCHSSDAERTKNKTSRQGPNLVPGATEKEEYRGRYQLSARSTAFLALDWLPANDPFGEGFFLRYDGWGTSIRLLEGHAL
jgi:hypothetical protein